MRKFWIPVATGATASVVLIGGLIAFGGFGKASNLAAAPGAAAQNERVALQDATAVKKRHRALAAPTPRISALRQLPAPTRQPAELSARLAALTNGAARIDQASVREAAPGMYLARRSDGLTCLISSVGGMCPSAMLDGGVALQPSSVRQGDQPDSPWLLSVTGIAIDGVSDVSLVFRDGAKSATMAVQNNVFASSVSGREASELTGYIVNGRTYVLPASTDGNSLRSSRKPGS